MKKFKFLTFILLFLTSFLYSAQIEMSEVKTKMDDLNNMLLQATQNNDIKKVNELLKKGANANFIGQLY